MVDREKFRKDLQTLQNALEDRKLRINNNPDKIRWDYLSSSAFNIKEET